MADFPIDRTVFSVLKVKYYFFLEGRIDPSSLSLKLNISFLEGRIDPCSLSLNLNITCF